MGIQQFRLPDVGEGLVEAEIVSWKVKAGDTVKLNDTVVEIETAKSLVELPIPYAGVVAELLVPEGETVPVGTPIIAVQTADATPGDLTPPVTEGTPKEDLVPTVPEDTGRTAVLVGYGPRTTDAKRRPRKTTPAAANRPAPGSPADAAPTGPAAHADGPPGHAGPTAVTAPAGHTGSPAHAAQPGTASSGPPTAGVAHAPTAPAGHAGLRGTASAGPPAPSVAHAPTAPIEGAFPAPGAYGGTSSAYIPAPASAPLGSPHPVGPDHAGTPVHVLAKPPVRKLAKDLGLDIAQVTATGPGGVVTRADVEAHAAAGSAAAEAAVTGAAVSGGGGVGAGGLLGSAGAGGTGLAGTGVAHPVVDEGDVRIPVKGVQKVMAQAMVNSAFTAPHVTEWITVDVTATMELVERLKQDKAFRELKVSPLLIVAKAVVLAARRTPIINAAWDEQAQEIILKRAVNLGIAAATPRGLIVPNIKSADSLTLPELCGALNELVATARDGRTQPADQAGGSFTITNVGVFGVDAGTPIINPGEAAILAFGAVRKQPWVVDDEIVPRWITTLALSFDHRLIDGEKGSTFLADVAAILEDPARALMF